MRHYSARLKAPLVVQLMHKEKMKLMSGITITPHANKARSKGRQFMRLFDTFAFATR